MDKPKEATENGRRRGGGGGGGGGEEKEVADVQVEVLEDKDDVTVDEIKTVIYGVNDLPPVYMWPIYDGFPTIK
nr:hypothetical protein BaRGS_017582 [Batillaria attramentaria]